tara:strand:+ start:67 stop:624 length:558 start_codon:yes stop_codon:yes gene_type:complete
MKRSEFNRQYWKKRLGIKDKPKLKTQSVEDFKEKGGNVKKVKEDPVSTFVQDYSLCQEFYKSKEWKELKSQFRYGTKHGQGIRLDEAFELSENPPTCAHCGIKVEDGAPKYLEWLKKKNPEHYAKVSKLKIGILNVDHIWPIKYYWHLRLDINNLQLLCKECNYYKANNHPRDHLLDEGFLGQHE